MDLSGYTLATLHQDSEFVLCRGRGTARPTPDPPSVLVTMPASEHPAADRVRMLEHELAFQAELDSTWAVRPLVLSHYQGRPALILEEQPLWTIRSRRTAGHSALDTRIENPRIEDQQTSISALTDRPAPERLERDLFSMASHRERSGHVLTSRLVR